MDRIADILKKVREDKRLSALVVTILVVCFLAVVGVFITLPEVDAAYATNTETMTQTDGVYKLTSLSDGTDGTVTTSTLDVDAGGTYIIDGEGVLKSNIALTIRYTGATGSDDSPAKVYITLKNVNMQQSNDISSIKLATGGNAVDYIVTIEGECSITSTCGNAKYPLITVEDTSYELYRLKDYKGNNATLEDYLITETASSQVNLVLQGATAVSSLSLKNAAGSYGALIGTGESGTFTTDSTKEINDMVNKLNGEVITEGEITITDASIVAQLRAYPYNFTPMSTIGNNEGAVFQPQYKYNSVNGMAAGNIVIGGTDAANPKPLVLNLTNNGYGASIGGGGSAAVSGKGADTGKVTINSGTITVKTPDTDYGSPVFGSGIASGTSAPESTYGKTGGVEINGGSVWFGSHANKFGNDLPVNEKGERVYEVKVTTGKESGETIADIDSLVGNDSFTLTYEYDSSLQFDLDLEKVTRNIIVDTGAYKYLDIDVMLNKTYNYEGAGHGDDALALWLPATETTSLVITDEFGPGYAKFTVTDSNKNVVEPVSDVETSTDSRRYVLIKGKTYYIAVSNIPSGLSVNKVTLKSDSVSTTASYVAGSGYRVVASDKSIEADVTYSGEIDVVYDDGLLADDRINHSVILPTEDYEYGTEELKLDDLGVIYKSSADGDLVPDLIFDGWMYTDAAGNEIGHITHITKEPGQDGNQRVYSDVVQSDGKIYLKAKWTVKTEYIIGDDATMTGGVPAAIEVEYAYGTGNVMDVSIPKQMPVKDSFAFTGWSVDDDKELINYNTVTGAINSVSLSSLTSHIIYANYERSGFSVYIDKASLNENFAELQCIGSTGTDILVRGTDGALATVVIDGKTYYYTGVVKKGSEIRVVISTVRGYKMENCNVTIKGSATNSVTTNSVTGECLADFTIENSDVFVSTNATFNPITYEITFKDGKEPEELLWSGSTFTYDIEDIISEKTIGDIIREGLGKSKAELSDEDIALYVNSIDKNTRFTDFSGWSNTFCADILDSDVTIASIFEDNSNLALGDLVFTATWTEYDKYAINMNLFEREFLENGLYTDVESDNLTAVLYYYTQGSTRVPVYTEEIIDEVTGEEKTIAYAKADDRIEIVLYRKNKYGKPYGEPVTAGIVAEQLYYEYESKVNEDVHADVKDGLLSFTIKNDVKDETTIEVYLAISLKKYTITYWDVRGFDNSANPLEYTIFDSFDFVPLTDGVDWLLISPDTDTSNDDDIKTEVIHGIRQDGKLVTDGTAGDRDYMANLVLKPDWADYTEGSYKIDIRIDNDAYGKVSVIYPVATEGYLPQDTIFLSVEPKEGYKLVEGSLVYRKDNSTTFMLAGGARLMTRDIDTFIIPVIDEEDGTYMFIMPSSDVIVTAEFELCQYSIVYSDITEDVTHTNPDSYNINSEIVLSDATREGYNFLGWYDAYGDRVYKLTGRTGNLVLTPKFELVDEENKLPDGEGDNKLPDGDGTNKPSGDSDGTGTDDKEPTVDNPSGSTNVTINGRPSNVVSRPTDVTLDSGSTGSDNAGVQTGDQTDIPRIILICVAAVIVLMIIVIKKPKDDENK